MIFFKSMQKLKVFVAALVLMSSMQAKAMLVMDGIGLIVQNDNWPPCFSCDVRMPTNTVGVILGGTVAMFMLTFGIAVLILDNESGAYKISQEALLANGYSAEEIQDISKGFEMLSEKVTEAQRSPEVIKINSKEDWKKFVLSTSNLPSAYVQFVMSEF